MIKITFRRKGCIGAGECEVLSPDLWNLQGDGKAILRGAIPNEKTGDLELVVDDIALPLQQRIASACPAGCIKITKVQ